MIGVIALLLSLSAGRLDIPSAAAAPNVRSSPWLNPSSPRLLGVLTDPWHSDEYERALEAHVQLIANFMPFGARLMPTNRLREAQRRGLTPMISWLPRESSAVMNPHAIQPAFSNASIAAGRQDAYIRRFARACAGFQGTILLRYAPEFEGSWEPWHVNPAAYVAAWRRVRLIFVQEGATNVKFIWSPALPWEQYTGGFQAWLRLIDRYWPGSSSVDYVGTTMVSHDRQGVDFFSKRIPLLRKFRKPVVLGEVYAPEQSRQTWLPDLVKMVNRMSYVRVVVWCDLTPSTPITRSPSRLALGGIEQG